MEALLPVFHPEPLVTVRGNFLKGDNIQLADVYGDRVILRELTVDKRPLPPRVIHVKYPIFWAKKVSGRVISSSGNHGDSLILITGPRPTDGGAIRFEWNDTVNAFETKRICKPTGIKALDCWPDGRVASWSYDSDLRLHRAPPKEREPGNVVDRIASRRRTGEVFEVTCLGDGRFGVLLRPPQNTASAIVSVYRLSGGPKKLEVEDMRVTIWGAQNAERGKCMRLICADKTGNSFIVVHPGGINIAFRESDRWQCLLPFKIHSRHSIVSVEVLDAVADRYKLLVSLDGPELWLLVLNLDRVSRLVTGTQERLELPSEATHVKLLAKDLLKIWLRDEHPLLCDVIVAPDMSCKPVLQDCMRVSLGFDFGKIDLSRAFYDDGRLIIPGYGSIYWHFPTRSHGLVPNSGGIRKTWRIARNKIAISTTTQTAVLDWNSEEKEFIPTTILTWFIQDETSIYADDVVQVTPSKINNHGNHLELDLDDGPAAHAIRSGHFLFIVTSCKLLKVDISQPVPSVSRSREVSNLQCVNMISLWRSHLSLAFHSKVDLYSTDTLDERRYPILYPNRIITGLKGNKVAFSDGMVCTFGHATKYKITDCGYGPVRLLELHDSLVLAVGIERSYIIGLAKGSFTPVPVTGTQNVTAVTPLNDQECAVVQNDLKVILFKPAVPKLDIANPLAEVTCISYGTDRTKLLTILGGRLCAGENMRFTLDFDHDIRGAIAAEATLLDENMEFVLLVEGTNVHALRADPLEVCCSIDLSARALSIHWIFEGSVAAVITDGFVIFLKTISSISGRLSISVSQRVSFIDNLDDGRFEVVGSTASDGKLAVKLSESSHMHSPVVQFLWMAPTLGPRSTPEHEGHLRVVATTCWRQKPTDDLKTAHVHSKVFVTMFEDFPTALSVVSSRYTGYHQDMYEDGEIYEVPIEDHPISRDEMMRMATLRSPLDTKPYFKNCESLSKNPINIRTEEAVIGTSWQVLRGVNVAWMRQLRKKSFCECDLNPHVLLLSPISGVNVLVGGRESASEKVALTKWTSESEVMRPFRLMGDLNASHRSQDTRELGDVVDARLVDGIDDIRVHLEDTPLSEDAESRLKYLSEQEASIKEFELREKAESLSYNDTLERFVLRNPGLPSSFLKHKIGRLALYCFCD